MRKFELLTIAILLIVFSAEKVYPQSKLCGHVFETNTTKALANANVFISGTVKGTVTNKEGYFEIQGVPSGSQRIIISLLGYETVTKFLMLEQDSTYEVSIELTPRIYSTGTVNITSSKSSFERQKDLKLFKELFLGKSKKEK
ncbi:MAG: carboxypeptidase-like regulatory domain-containing protein [Bacteroidota bacterium]|nr:carboxypeptidase-like regulatory domain-containing protein [Bacteroidota bacterium]